MEQEEAGILMDDVKPASRQPISEADVRSCIGQNYHTLVRRIYWIIRRDEPIFREQDTSHMQDVASHVMCEVLEKIAQIVDTINKDDFQNEFGQRPLEQQVAAVVASFTRYRARNAARSRRRNRKRETPLEVEIDDNLIPCPSAVSKPEQEDVVFIKQLLAKILGIRGIERKVMLEIFDRATLGELRNALGIPMERLVAIRRQLGSIANSCGIDGATVEAIAGEKIFDKEAIEKMTDDEVESEVANILWASNGGRPICPSCKSLDAYRISTRRRWKCKECGKQYSVTSASLFKWRKMPLREYLYILTHQPDFSGNRLAAAKENGWEWKTAQSLFSRVDVMIADSKSPSPTGSPQVERNRT